MLCYCKQEHTFFDLWETYPFKFNDYSVILYECKTISKELLISADSFNIHFYPMFYNKRYIRNKYQSPKGILQLEENGSIPDNCYEIFDHIEYKEKLELVPSLRYLRRNR